MRLDPSKEFNIDFNNPATLNQYYKFIKSAETFGKFISFTFGMDIFARDFIFGFLAIPIYISYNDPNFA